MENLERNELIEGFLSKLNTEIDVIYHIDIDEVTNFESITEMIDNNGGFQVDVIYYSNAMEYLTENDTSLNLSLEIASDLGFEVSDLNSETLASLLKSQIVREEWEDLESEVNEFLNDLK